MSSLFALPSLFPDLVHRVICGNTLDPTILPTSKVDLTVTSPPYNIGMAYQSSDDTIDYCDYLRFSERWLENVYHWTSSTGRLCLNIGLDKNKFGKAPVAADITHIAMKVGWKYHATIIWNEGNISRRTAWGSWMSARAPHVIAPVEVILVLYKDQWRRKERGDSDISAEEFKEWVLGLWTFSGEQKRLGHIAPFPRELPKRCIKLFSYVWDTILDPFLGSGTTMIEAMNHHRRAIGIDISSQYCHLALKRMKTLDVVGNSNLEYNGNE